MILKNLLRRKTRTILTVVGIAIGIGAIVALVALSRGLVANYAEVTAKSDADLVVSKVREAGQAMEFGDPLFDERVAEQLRVMPEVRAVAGLLYTIVPVSELPYFVIFGYDPDEFAISHFKIIEGDSLTTSRARGGGKPLILGRIAAENLHKGIGDTLRIYGRIYRVVGIYETGVVMEDGGAVLALDEVQRLMDAPHQVMGILIQLRHPERLEEARERIVRRIPKDLSVSRTEEATSFAEILSLLDAFAWGIAFIAALVGGVGMMNSVLMSVFERTREIGVLRAVGWSRGRVMRMILGESLLLSLAGGTAGIAIGVGLVRLAALSPSVSGLTRGAITPHLLAQAFTAAVILGLTSGAYPAWRASRLTPVEALRYDGGSSWRGGWKLPVGGMAVNNLARQRTRTLLTLVGVSIAVLAVVSIKGWIEGFSVALNKQVAKVELMAIEAGISDTSLSAIDERIAKRIEARPDVAFVSGMQMAFVSLPEMPFFIIWGRSYSDPLLSEAILREGTLLNGRKQMLLGWKAAKTLKKGVGDRVYALGTSFRVVGIIETGNMYEDSGAIIDLREAQQLLNKPRQIMLLQIKLVDPKQTDKILAQLREEYPELSFSRSAEFVESMPDMRNSESMMNSIFWLTALVGGVALMNTMIMSVYERTREIGVLRALGWKRRQVVSLILGEALMLTLLSGALGTAGAWLLGGLLTRFPNLSNLGNMVYISWQLVGQTVTMCVLLGIAGGLYPAWRAMRLSPVEALRYE